jgi:hypothetical protein
MERLIPSEHPSNYELEGNEVHSIKFIFDAKRHRFYIAFGYLTVTCGEMQVSTGEGSKHIVDTKLKS